jgi:energy-coupling factor transporter ATP-binding protein EcfA2
VPELRNRPLLDTLVDAELYIERDEARRLRSALEHGLNTLILGSRGSGKSTLLRQTARELRERERPSLFVNVDFAGDATQILETISAAAGQSTPDGVLHLDVIGAVAGDGSAVERIRSIAAAEPLDPPLVVLLDDVSANAGHELFGRLRDALWQVPVTWVVATGERALLTPPADAFFEQTIELAPMDAGLIAQLLHRRLGGDADRIGHLADLAYASDGSPRRALELAREIVVGRRSLDQILALRSQREACASTLGRPASMLLAEIQQLDRPVYSADEELLHSMGWTRNRAVQVLGELETAGLLTSYPGRGPGGGRVKFFAVNDAWQPS